MIYIDNICYRVVEIVLGSAEEKDSAPDESLLGVYYYIISNEGKLGVAYNCNDWNSDIFPNYAMLLECKGQDVKITKSNNGSLIKVTDNGQNAVHAVCAEMLPVEEAPGRWWYALRLSTKLIESY